MFAASHKGTKISFWKIGPQPKVFEKNWVIFQELVAHIHNCSVGVSTFIQHPFKGLHFTKGGVMSAKALPFI